MLDAAACGLPIVVNHTLQAVERIEGNGVTYRLGDLADLTEVLRQFISADRRHELGAAGAQKMQRQFSWRSLAASRLRDYERFAAQGSPGGWT
jgi:glycosyltransferase involved in cell wall biosynthesis